MDTLEHLYRRSCFCCTRIGALRSISLPVTIQAPAHIQRLLLPGHRHLIPPPVTTRATNSLVHMNAMIKVNVIRQVIDSRPAKRSAILHAVPHRLQNRRILPNLRMTSHACVGGRHASEGRFLDGRVAIPAVNPQSRHMMLVAEGHRLCERFLFACPIIRTSKRINHPASTEENQNAAHDRGIGDRICAAFEKLGHAPK